jgi:hypothetical protein
MKLSSARVERTLTQFDARAIPDTHPAVPQLNSAFGEHTFFLDEEGLSIVELAEPTRAGTPAGKVVKLASWKDEAKTSLAPHPPEPTDVIVEFGADGAD